MEPEFKNDIFENDISIEEFDHITDGVEDHVFSDRYQSRKETIMNNVRHKAKVSKLGVKIVAAASESRETPVWCMVYEDLEYTREADIFANQMKYTKPLSPFEIFMANIEAGSDEQIIIRDLVESYGLMISAKSGPGNVRAVGSLEYIYRKYGYQVLERTLSLDIGTWEGTPQSLSANMLKGLARLIVVYNDELKDDTFKEKLGIISCKEITQEAKVRKAGSMGFTETFLNYYNKKTRFGLERAKLY